MAFNGSEGKPINLETAAEWTRAHRAANPKGLQALFFGRDILMTILKQQDCKGIRLYYGLSGGEPQLLAVGANAEENDQLGDGFIVADDSVRCPPCGQANILNS